MEYTISFDFNCINKQNLISGKSGEVDVTSNASAENLKNNKDLIGLIAIDMGKKTKQSIISVDIKDVRIK